MENKGIAKKVLTYGVLLSVIAIVLYFTIGNNEMISLNKPSFHIGDIAEITINSENLTEMRIEILTPNAIYKFVNPKKKLKYRINEEGNFTINLYDKEDLISSKFFEAGKLSKENISSQSFDYFILDKNKYMRGEDVIISFNESLLSINKTFIINSPSQKFNFVNSERKRFRFIPREEGEYIASLYMGDILLESESFNVGKHCPFCGINLTNSSENNLGNLSFTDVPSFFIKDSKGGLKNFNIIVHGREKKGRAFDRFNLTKGRYNITLYPEISGINSIDFKGVEYDNAFDLGLEDIPSDSVNIPGTKTKKAFSIDPSGLNFSTAKMDVNAVGIKLMKCKDWNFAEQRCYGKWEFIRYITPGENYSIDIDSSDPGFAEVGLASINTERPIYHPDEEVKLTIVVLDNSGNLVSGANVNLEIKMPDNMTINFSTSGSTITELQAGIYEAIFNNASNVGRYDLFVKALGDNVNNTMFSYFDVASYYEFEISRDMLVTIDPFRNILAGKIKIASYSNMTGFSYTEKLPLDFSVYDLGGAINTTTNDSILLTWNSLLQNSSITYKAKLPPISPALYELQGYVTYSDFNGTNIFEEARPWFIAADPSTSYFTTFATCSGNPVFGDWIDTACAGDDIGNTVAITSNYTCNFTDVLPANANLLSVNVTVLSVLVLLDNSLNVVLNNQNLGTIATTNGGCGSDGSFSYPLNTLTRYNIGGANRIDINPVAAARVALNDDDTASDNVIRVDVSYTMKPNITLNYPADGAAILKGRIDFNFTARDDDSSVMKNCSLFSTFNGSFSPNTTILNVANNTNINITQNVTPGNYIWGVRCFDNNGAEAFSENRTLYVTKLIRMFYPDRAAPGMNVVLTVIGEDLNSTETVLSNTSDIVFGPTISTNQTGHFVNNNAKIIQVPMFIKETAIAQNASLNISRTIPQWKFEIYNPTAGSGNFTGGAGLRILGNGGANETRSLFGTVVLDTLIIPSGVTVEVIKTDRDNNASNGNQGYLPAIILVKGNVNIQGVFNVSGSNGQTATTDVGGSGGNGGPGGGGGAGGAGDNNNGGNGGNGFTGGGSGGMDLGNGLGGISGSGTGLNSTVSADEHGRTGGYAFPGFPNGGGAGNGSADDGGGGAGGTGFVFGSSGIGGAGLTAAANSGGAGGLGGGGGGDSDASNEGGGGGFGAAGGSGETGTGGQITGSSQLIPLSGGSGGGAGGSNSDGTADDGGGAGGGGGGSLQIYSKIQILVTNFIYSVGGNGGACTDTTNCGEGGAGSGGAIILQAPYVFVNGTLDANGGNGTGGSGLGGDGRIRIDGLTLPSSYPTLLSSYNGSNFTGPMISNVTDSSINGTATPNSVVNIYSSTGSGSIVSYNGTANSNGIFQVSVNLPAGTNYISVVQNTSSNRIVVAGPAAMTTFTGGTTPVINSVECEFNTTGNWQICSNALYGSTILQIRSNCTIAGASISNVSFLMTNVPDLKTIILGNTTNSSTGFFVFDNNNAQILDSGNFDLNVTCNANNSNSANYYLAWSVPWGVLNSTLIAPTTATDVTQNTTFNFTSKLTCLFGECQSVNASLWHSNIMTTKNLSFKIPDAESHFSSLSAFTASSGNLASLQTNVVDPGAAAAYLAYELVDPLATNNVTQQFAYNVSSFNLSGSQINIINFSGQLFLTGGWTDPGPEAGDPMECGNVGDAYIQIYNGSTWENIGTPVIDQQVGFNDGAGGGPATAWDSEGPPFTKQKSSGFNDAYINSTGFINLRFFWKDIDCTVGESANPDAAFIWDYGFITINYTNVTRYSLVSTSAGAKPFWTYNNNPYTQITTSCLANLTAGATCNTTWMSNATGDIGTIWDFFANYSAYSYPSNITQNETRHVNITIVDFIRPTVSNITCQANAGSWTTCSNIIYGDTLTGVRAKCYYPPGGSITNVTFSLLNLFDNNTYFTSATTDNSTGFWLLSTSRLINDSGDFNLSVTCYAATTGSSSANWTIPFGTLTVDWYNPTIDVNVTQYDFSNFSAQVICSSGECINLTLILDPELVYNIANMTYEPGTDFPIVDGICPTTNTCAATTPWDAFDNCIAGNGGGGGYGICASSYTNKIDLRGLMCRGCDRNDGPNAGGLYLNINNTACGGFSCSSIFLSFYHVVQSMDVDSQGSGVWINDSDGVLRSISRCMRGSSTCDCDRIAGCTQATMGQYAEYVSVNICSVSGIDCSLPITIRFTSHNSTVNHDSNEYFGWDNINITGLLPKGVIPYGSGAPFYTLTANPMSWKNNSCLAHLNSGDSCIATWRVNATGTLFSSHDFFVNGSTFENGSGVHSGIITVIILNETAPYVESITLSPSQPVDASDLNCTFTIHDPNYFDTLTANVSWYRNNVLNLSTIISITGDVPTTNILGNGNTSNGETWFCSVTPSDGKMNGTTANSSSVTILISNPPVVNNLQCQVNTTTWGTCNNVHYNEIITAVRANCTDPDGSVANVTFNLSNYEDSNTFFTGTVSVPAGVYYVYDNNDMLVKDSGNFSLSALCIDNSGVSTTSVYSWIIPFGTLNITFTKPTRNVNITQYRLSNFTVSITCTGGECGNVTAVLDPLRAYLKANLTFESPTNFPLAAGDCGTGAGWQCASSTPWDDFDNCLDSNGAYGICASLQANSGSSGTRGLECVGCDRFDASNVGGLYINISSRFCNGYVCQAINVSYYQIVDDMDAATEGSAVLVRDQDGVWRNLSVCLDNDLDCDCNVISGCSRANFGQYAEYISADLCQISGINCSENITMFFTSAYPIAQGTSDFFAWDEINVTAYGMKGIIPVSSGFPFYSVENNPRTATDNSCLFNMSSGSSCTIFWNVNSTGSINTTHEIFAYVNSTYTSINVSETIHYNVTININFAPNVTSVTLGPSSPLNDTDLNCTFTLTDNNYFDSLFANVSWYRNGTLRLIQNVSAAIDTATSTYLTANNTEPGDYWTCGVTPFDQNLWGAQRNSSNVTIYLFSPPSINSIQCQVNGAWGACSSATYYKNFSAVRTNCSSPSGMMNATFNLTNIPDNNLFYNNLTTVNSSGYLTFDQQDINITDSGEWRLYVKCIDANSQIVTGLANWTVAWGSLSAVLVNPDSNTNVQQKAFFSFSSKVTCSGGECGNINATLDPYNTTTVYDYRSGFGTDKFAFIVDSNNNPPESLPNSRTALSNAQVAQINISDDTRYVMADPGAGDYGTLEMIMVLNHSATDIKKIQLIFEGRASLASNATIYAWNYVSGAWVQIGSLLMAIGSDNTEVVNITSGISNYVNSSRHLRWAVLDTVTSEFLHVDYVAANITYDVYKGTLSTIQGAIPFYTTDKNSKDYTNQSCLFNMTSGQSCTTTWNVNATGPVGSIHEFFAYYNSTNYSAYLQGGATSHIFITITDQALVPPTTTLISPATGTYTNNPNQTFFCNSTDSVGLLNISLYANFNTSFIENESRNVTGTNATVNFTKSLSDGAYFWNCLAYDTDNNNDWAATNWTITIDTVPPTLYVAYPPNDTILTTSSVDFNFTAYDALDSVLICNLTLDSVVEFLNFNVNNNTWTIKAKTGLSVDDHYWSLSCYDNAFNINISETYHFSVGDLPPSVTLVTANNSYFNSPNITLYYSASDNSNVEISNLILNGVINQTNYNVSNGGTSDFNVTNVAQGRYNWTVNVSDISNLSNQAGLRFFIVDYTIPTINLNFPSDNYSTNLTVTIVNFTAIDNFDSSLLCNITVNGLVANASIAATNNTPKTFDVIAFTDGINYWNVSCSDDAGNYNTSQTRMVNVSAPPTVTLIAPADSYSQNTTDLNFTYTPYDNVNLSKCDLIINNVFNQTNATRVVNNHQNNFSLSNMGEGNYLWLVNCTDTFNLSTLSSSRTVTIDQTKPYIVLYYPAPGDTVYGTFTNFNLTAIDNLDTILNCNLTVDGVVKDANFTVANNTPTNRSVNVSVVGIHFWNATCWDNAGNYNTSNTRNYSTQNPPLVSLSFPEDNALLGFSLVNFSYIPTDNDLNNATLIIGGINNQTNTTLTTEELNYFRVSFIDGTYNWTVNVTDATALSTTPSPRRFTVDTTAPVINMRHPNSTEIIDWNEVKLNFSIIDNIDTSMICNVSVNGILEYSNVASANNTEVIRYKALADGSHSWNLTCRDDANNSANSQVSFTVEAPPRITLLSPANNTRLTNTSITYDYFPYDIFGIQNCSLLINNIATENSSSITNNQTNSFTTNGVAEGLYNWTVRCIDAAPDLNPNSSIPWIYRVDRTGPTIVLKKPLVDETLNLNNVTFNYTATDSDNIVIDCNISVSDSAGNRLNSTSQPAAVDHIITIVNFTDGDHFWNVTCIDDLGNSNTSETRRFIINQADLFTNDSRVSFNNTNPDLNENISIFVNISNLGGQIANNLLVTFYDGNPAAGGIFIGNDTNTVALNQTVRFRTSWLITPGYHTIYISADPYNVIPELNETNNNATINISALWANITGPVNGTWWNTLTVPFNFTIRDYRGGTINYTVIVDNSANGQNGSVVDDALNPINITFTQGIHNVRIRANDTLGRIKDSNTITVLIDTTAPTVNFITANLSWFNNTIPTLNFTITDNLDPMLNYTIYVNGIAGATGNATNNTLQSINLAALPNGTHTVFIESFDEAGNRQNSSVLTFFVDTVEPTINLIYPPNSANFFLNSLIFNFSVIDNIDPLLTCNFTLDGAVNVSNINAYNNTFNLTNISNLGEAVHYWNVTCWDGNSATPVNMKNTSRTFSFSVFDNPVITLVSPLDNNWTNIENATFFFNAGDTSGLLNCSLLVNGQVSATKTTAQLVNNGLNNFSASMLNGTYLWGVQCFDNTVFNNYAVTSNRTLNVDLDTPFPFLETLNETWFNTATPQIRFNITDNMDTVLNYSLFINESVNKQGTASNATSTATNLNSITDGYYSLLLEGLDEAYNRRNTTAIKIYVDTTPPTVSLIKPDNGNSSQNTSMYFNFTASDNLAATMLCNLTVDNTIMQTFNTTSGSTNGTIFIITAGTHFWNVTCIDVVGNRNTSQTWNFTIPLPDVAVFSSGINFNTSFPEEGKNITINATVYNLGETNAAVLIQFFQGNYTLGNQIMNFTYNITAKGNVTVNVSWRVPVVGAVDIYVVVDPPIATGGSIPESNESNNYAFKSISISSYEIVYGNFSGVLNIESAANRTIYEWNVLNFTGSKIYAVDYDSVVSWSNLQALGRGTSGASDFDDFIQLDRALLMENNSDSLNFTWTLLGAPRLTDIFTIYNNPISNVPIVNSTNVTFFTTGVLWDTSDPNNGLYNGTQDVVFVTRVIQNQSGLLGNYDFELKIPSYLKRYKGPDSQRVLLYTEIS